MYENKNINSDSGRNLSDRADSLVAESNIVLGRGTRHHRRYRADPNPHFQQSEIRWDI